MTLADLLKIAAAFGIDKAYLRQLVIEEGLPFARRWVKGEIRERMEARIPKILKNLAQKAPLDGKKRKDKDGVEWEDWQFLCHESLYLLVKVVVIRGGLFVDGWRDAHLSKVMASVESGERSTPEAVVRATMDAELDLTF